MSEPSERLRDAIDELYSLEPAEFVARRDQRVKDARAVQDRELANALKALRRPTLGAWYVNIAARAPLASLHAFDKLGRRLRVAQTAGDFAAVMELGRERGEAERRVLADLAAHIERLGYTVSDAALEDVRATLRATLADEDAARAALSGALVKPLTGAAPDSAWFGIALSPVGIKGDVGRAPGKGREVLEDAAASEIADLDAARARRAEQARLARRAELEALATAAEGRVHQAEAAASAARASVADLDAQMSDLTEQIAALREQLADVQVARQSALQRVQQAAAETERARAEAARARQKLSDTEAAGPA